MIYYINYKKEQENNAGNKAPDDIAKVCKGLRFTEFSIPSMPIGMNSLHGKLWILVHAPIWWRRLSKTVNENDTVIYQHPMYGNRLSLRNINKIKKKKKCKFVVLIHDLESLRNGVEGEYKVNKKTSDIADNDLLKLFDKVICHNRYMMDYLISKGFEKNKLIDLEIFDYLCDTPILNQTIDLSEITIAIAGNLSWGKSRYIYELGTYLEKSSHVRINLYGNNFDRSRASDSLCYKGSFNPDELPGVLEGQFGLVWDGISAESCVGNTGEYLRYNNPHKTSLYISSGIPVIVWSQAAISDFVINNHVGIVVDSLLDIEAAINKITLDDYNRMRENAISLGEKLRTGFFYTKSN